MTPSADPRRVVAEGYDAVAARYQEWMASGVDDPVRQRYTDALLDHLPPGARVLELGCGGGGPTTARLAARFRFVGVDLSAGQLAFARRSLPDAALVQADMTRLHFPARTFDGVASFYALTHLPHGELPALVRRVADWLRPGGRLVASFGTRLNPGFVEDDWLGAPMYFSGYPPAQTERFLAEAGFALVSGRVETIVEEGRPARFYWIAADKLAT